jgi:hypothetical protein
VPSTLPDVNAETYPFEVVQCLLDQTATFAFHATPKPGFADSAWLIPETPEDFFGIDGGYGLHLCCDLHRLESTVHVGGLNGVGIRQAAGEPIGEFRAILMFASFPDAQLHWEPSLPPPAIYDRWRSQRFVLTHPQISFDRVGRMRGLGVGHTYPINVGGATELLAGAVCNLDRGTGIFSGLEASVAMSGILTRGLGFDGTITVRIPDSTGRLRSETVAPDVDASGPQPVGTVILLRGEKKDRTVKTSFGPKPGPDLDSLVTPSQMRAVRYGCAIGDESIKGDMTVGPIVAHMNADVHFNLEAPPGTSDRPGPFTTSELYEFVDPCGGVPGTLSASVEEGISFGLQFPAAPGQPGVRFTGYGPIRGGTGAFEGAEGVLTVNSVIGIAPHVLSLTHVLYLVDPGGRFRV